MMNPIIKDFLEQGHIDKEAAARLENFEGMLKQADWMTVLKDIGLNILKGVVPAAAGSIAGQIAFDSLGKRKLEEQDEHTRARMVHSFGNMMKKHPELEENRPMVAQRFNEIAALSPTVATSPSVAKKIIDRTMTSGLDEKDMQSLMSLELNSRNLNHRPIPKTLSGGLAQGVLTGLGQSVSHGLTAMSHSSVAGASSSSAPAGGRTIGGTAISAIGGNIIRNGDDFAKAYVVLDKKGFNFPGGLQGLDMTNKIDFTKFITYISEQGTSPVNDWMASAGFKNMSEVHTAMDQELIKQATVLANQYSLLKVAAPTKAVGMLQKAWEANKKTVYGLGLAGVFGSAVAGMEEAADYARTKAQNKKIKTSWEKTQTNLKGLSESGDRLSSEINYKDKATATKALDTFKVLADIAPGLAANSTIATSFVNTVMLNEGQVTPDFIKMLSETQKNLSATSEYRSPFAESPIASGFGSGFGAAGGTSLIKGVAEQIAKG